VLTLRISHTASRVKVTVEGAGPRHAEERPFSFALSDQDVEDIRWYLEDYRVYPVDPQPKFAKRIERRMSDIGRELFQAVLVGSDAWSAVRVRLADTRIEIETELEDASVPWELLRDPVGPQPRAPTPDVAKRVLQNGFGRRDSAAHRRLHAGLETV
jgi:hypothetical protein